MKLIWILDGSILKPVASMCNHDAPSSKYAWRWIFSIYEIYFHLLEALFCVCVLVKGNHNDTSMFILLS